MAKVFSFIFDEFLPKSTVAFAFLRLNDFFMMNKGEYIDGF